MRKSIVYCLIVTIFAGSFVTAVEDDRLRDAYEDSHEIQADPYATDIEARDLFNTTNSIDPISGIGGGNLIQQNDSVFVRFARFMLRLVVLVAVPMLIYAGIRIMFALGDDAKLKETIKHLVNVGLGILLAMASVMIIFLITSLTRSSLPFFNT